MGTLHSSVLFVDDEIDLCTLMQMTLAKIGITTDTAHTLTQARNKLVRKHYDACITDLNLPDGHGLDLVSFVTQNFPHTPIAVLTAYGSMEIAIQALKMGAFDFVSKPINQQHLYQLMQKALNIPPEGTSTDEERIENKLLIGHSKAIQQLKLSIKKIARSQAPVFIMGESGTGKEVVAHLLHHLSNRQQGPFIAINCGAIPLDLMESEFFGHKKGSFTGAVQDKQGLIQAADGGSLFLDEIAELPLSMQVKLLRAVQEKKIRPVGSDTEIEVDFRVLSASHRDLESLVQQGLFRQDLFFRLHVMLIHIPPLREREQDAILLAQHFIEHLCAEWKIPLKKLSTEAEQFLLCQHYAGNVRELRNIIERALTLSESETIDIQQLQVTPFRTGLDATESAILQISNIENDLQNTLNDVSENGLEQYLADIEKDILLNALNQTHWNRTLAAKKLGMTFRSLRYRLKKYGLDLQQD